ncbi:MAG: ATP-dependent Clp protease ATP-binding subunit [Bacteroidaceae bacterium]|nr:ATP-dependent Clp protease ATP-binding subunit [Bacteroidaceae bacterium]
MKKQYSKEFEQCIRYSREEAIRLHSRSIRAEHFILGILREGNSRAAQILGLMGIHTEQIKKELENYLSNITVVDSGLIDPENFFLEDSASTALKESIAEAERSHDELVKAEHLLLAILRNTQCAACRLLNANGINYERTELALTFQTETLPKDNIHFDEDEDDEDDAPDAKGNTARTQVHNRDKATDGKTPLLDKYTTDITKNAAEHKLDKVIGREKEIERIAQILSRRKKNNPILIGEPGVGKTAIVEGLAERIVKMDVPPVLAGKRLVALDMATLVAGTKYRGQFEERVQGIMKELAAHPEIIIFIDEIHTMVGAGSSQGTLDAANILKPALSRGELQCIGATTINEFRKSIERDGALERRFQKIMVHPNTNAETLEILKNIKGHYEEHHNVTYSDDALKACVDLTDRYITDRQQPDKAIDAMDEAGASVRIGQEGFPDSIRQLTQQLEQITQQKQLAVKQQNFERAATLRDQESQMQATIKDAKHQWEEEQKQNRRPVSLEDVENTVSLMSGVPVQRMASQETIRIRGLRQNLQDNIIQQDDAIDKLVKAIMRNRIGLRDPNKPIGTFMFLGPTGVGKTYLTEKLAEYMFGTKEALIRIDMSEYMEKFSTSRLVGAPPGYVGYEEGGQLTEQVRRRPYSIILLDEIEKASHDVFNLLLQVMDEGRLTDSLGNTVDFKNTIIIFTSNTGSREVSEFGRGVGFSAGEEGNEDSLKSQLIMKSLNKRFAPEFINRLDEIIMFKPLNKKSIEKIATLEINELKERILPMGYQVEIGPKALDFIVEKGYDNKYGARPLKRAIQSYLEDGIGELIMEGKASPGVTIRVSKQPNKDQLHFSVAGK